MRRWVILTVLTMTVLAGCRPPAAPVTPAQALDAPFPATWTPTPVVEETPTATRVVWPSPTWDGTPPPPSLDAVPRISPARLERALRGDTLRGLASGVLVVDVRSLAAYEQAHLAGAAHIPLEELADRAGELDGNQTIVAYVLSASESGAAQAALILYELGFTSVMVLEGGIQQWYADGYAVEGTWLTPTPDEVGPPWSVTPIVTGTLAPIADATPTRVLQELPGTPTLNVTVTLTPTNQGP